MIVGRDNLSNSYWVDAPSSGERATTPVAGPDMIRRDWEFRSHEKPPPLARLWSPRVCPGAIHRRRGRGDGRGRRDGRGRARRTDRGELVPMSPKGSQHEAVKSALVDRWIRATQRLQADPGNDFPLERGHLSRARYRHISPGDRPQGTDGSERAARRRDLRLVTTLRHGAK